MNIPCDSGISNMCWLDRVQVQRYDRLYDATPSATLSLGQALDSIVDGTYAPVITHLRQLYVRQGEDAYAVAKRRLPQVTFGGTFSPTRAKAHLVQHSGLVHADLDHLQDVAETKLTLMQDPHVVYIFISPRSDGLKYGTRIAPVDSDAAYQHAWQVVADAHQKLYGVVWDPSGRDVSRLCFVSSDPACFINPDAHIFSVPLPPPPPPRPRVVMHAPYARSYVERRAQRALESAVRMVREAPVHHQHVARCRAAYLLGGYVGSGHLSYVEAYAALEAAVRETAENQRKALKDITDGLIAGQTKPITAERSYAIPQMTTIDAKELPPWHV